MLGQATGYAVSALGYLATGGGRPMLIRELAEACDIPSAYLAKIVNTLRRAGIVDTQRGVGGGVTLAVPAEAVSLYQIADALGDGVCRQRCMLGESTCTDERACPAHRFWKPHRAEAIDFLERTSIADVAAFETRRRTKALRDSSTPVPLTLGLSLNRTAATSAEALSGEGFRQDRI
jgi:Rrf2 family transcriptional regulator, iron-sulfur cluster assembly transcription factor